MLPARRDRQRAGADVGGTELIVVDDGSTDESRKILTEYGNRLRTVLKENGGEARAANAGFRHHSLQALVPACETS